MKKMIALLLAFTLALAFTGSVSGETTGTTSGASSITLNGDSIFFEGTGATIDGTTITITSAGTYTITGSLNDGQIRVDTPDKETVKLVLNGVSIACSTTAPIYIVNAEKTVIALAEGSTNSIADGTSSVFEDAASDKPDAAIFSNDDLTINGDGSLTVTGGYNHGIASSDDLKINGGHITVSSVNDGIRGRDSVSVRDGTIIVNAGGDGIQSNNDEDAEKGYVSIEGGSLAITAGEDGIQAETTLSVSGGTVTISSGSGSASCSNTQAAGGNQWGGFGPGTNTAPDDTADSMKGLKAGVAVIVSGGTITIDSSDDSVHSNDRITISGGTITASSGDDAMHSDSRIEIDGGDLRIAKSYEGIESAAITINAGTIHIVSSDDGINVVGSNDGSAAYGGPGQNTYTASGTNNLHINGGYIVIDAAGDGIDVNGPIEMNGGVVIVNGPTNNGNGPVDYTGSFTITGGDFLAVGSSGMAMAPDTASTQNSVMMTFSSAVPAGTMVHIEMEDGTDVLTFVPTKAYQSVVFSSPDLVKGATYVVHTGGSATGTVTDGLYSGGKYTAGTKVTSFTIAGIVTRVGSSNNQNPWTSPGNTQPDPGTTMGNNTGPEPWTSPGNKPRPDPGTNPGDNPGSTPGYKLGNPAVPTDAPAQTPLGSLSVTSSPSGSRVCLDGTYMGLTPLTLTGVAAGSHQLTLTKPGYQDYLTSVTVSEEKTSTISATLPALSGRASSSALSLQADRANNSRYVRFAASPPITTEEIPAMESSS